MTSTNEPIQRADERKTGGGKHLTFKLQDEEYGVELLKIKEIIGFMSITKVPQAPDYIKGVINLRGKIIPVVDLRMLFGMAAQDYTDRTCIIVAEIQRPSATVLVGLVVDSVSEVVNLKQEDIEDAPEFTENLNTDYILGLAKTDDKVKILLDVEKMLDVEEICIAA